MTKTVALPKDLRANLDKLSRSEGIAVEDIVLDMIRRQLAIREFRELAEKSERPMREAGFTSEEEVLKAFST